jgi:hypothetical protein
MKGVLMKENFLYSLEIMGKGMASIFIVILVLTLIVIFLASWPSIKVKLFGHRKQSENNQA